MGNPDNNNNSNIPVFSSTGGPSVGMAMYTQMPPLNNTITEPWSVGLCDCFSDCGNFCKSFWCPCITFGQVSEIVDRGSSSCGVNGGLYLLLTALTGLGGCIYSCVYRSKMREMFKLQGSGAQDCLIHACCEPCALTQMYRQLQNRGFQVSLGWHENVQRQTRGVSAMALAPPTIQVGMNR